LAGADPDNPLPEMEPEARQELLSDLTTRLLLARSKTMPTVLLIDNAQWLDAESNALVGRLVESLAETKLLLLLTFRPGYHTNWTGKAYYHQLALRPLPVEASEEILRGLTGGHPSLAESISVILERTRGYPYFVEEVVRFLAMTRFLSGRPGAYSLSRPIEPYEVPATLESVVTARLEDLGELERRVVYAAAIIGGRVPIPVLRRVADLSERELWRALGELEEAAFLANDSWSPTAGCQFVHPVAQEVAYYSQPVQKRVHLHGVVARALEEEYASNLGEHAALIAHHWDAANDKFKADLWRRRALRGVKQIQMRRPPRKKPQ
jgi:predicted ATPase